jgi:predicted Zn-dependent protease
MVRPLLPEEAIRSLRRAAELVPSSYGWLCHTVIGHAYLTMGAPDKAIPELEAAAHDGAQSPEVHYYLEQAYRSVGRNEDASRERSEFLHLEAQQDPLGLPGFGRAPVQAR